MSEKQIPFGNDNKKSKSNSNSNGLLRKYQVERDQYCENAQGQDEGFLVPG